MTIADLRETLEYVKTHRNEYDPSTWFSGTTADLAGHLVMRAGWTPIEDQENINIISHKITKGDKARYIHFVAAEIAGISIWEGHCLWSATATLDSLETMVRRLESDQAIYETLFAPTTAFEHAWTDARDRIVVACHRRTTYVRIGSVTEKRDWPTRQDALDYALDCAACRIVTRHHNPDA